MAPQSIWKTLAIGAVCVGLAAGFGCHGQHIQEHKDYSHHNVADVPVPKELNKVSLPPYVIEAPDIVIIEGVRIIPLPPYRIEPLDILYLAGKNVHEADPINGLYPVDPDGTINLGPAYGGKFRVAGLTTEDIQAEVQKKIRSMFAKNAEITVSLAQSRGVQQISGQHIVRSDGTVTAEINPGNLTARKSTRAITSSRSIPPS